MKKIFILITILYGVVTAAAAPPTGFARFYTAELVRVYDGDTVWLNIDVGMNITIANQAVRLFGIDAPEMRGEEAQAGRVSRDALRDLLAGREITLETHEQDGRGKFGRVLGTLWVRDNAGTYLNVNLWMLKHYAEAADY